MMLLREEESVGVGSKKMDKYCGMGMLDGMSNNGGVNLEKKVSIENISVSNSQSS